MTTHRTLLLWDIDLTLVDYTGIGGEWYTTALAQVVGVRLAHLPRFGGRTELSITKELLGAHGAEITDEYVDRMFAQLVSVARAAEPTMAERGRLLPGVHELLPALAERTDVVQSLVTGNLPEVAELKLRPFGLDRHVDLEVGGYGSISEHRHDLVASAIELAERKYGAPFPPSSVVVVGDTPHDVAGALHHGAVAVGVATGRASAQELTDSGAHAVLPDLADTALALRTLLTAPR